MQAQCTDHLGVRQASTHALADGAEGCLGDPCHGAEDDVALRKESASLFDAIHDVSVAEQRDSRDG